MPNWKRNFLTIKADLNTCLEIKEAVCKVHVEDGKEVVNAFDLEKIIPYPAEIVEAIKHARDFGNGIRAMADGEYEFCTNVWGTKWNTSMVEVTLQEPTDTDSSATLCYVFDTAWRSPWGCLEALSRKFPEVEIRLNTFDSDDCCWHTYESGKFVKGEFISDINSDKERKKMFREFCRKLNAA